jgi:hypothetical protein
MNIGWGSFGSLCRRVGMGGGGTKWSLSSYSRSISCSSSLSSSSLWRFPTLLRRGYVDHILAAATGETYQYELAVIGGGSGGIACAKEAGLLLGPNKTVVRMGL